MKYLISLFCLALLSFGIIANAQTIELPQDTVWGLTWSPDGSEIAVGRFNGRVEIRNAASEEIVRTLETGNSLPIATLTWSPDGSRIAGSDGKTGVFIWDAQTGLLERTLEGQHTSYVANLSWSPDSNRLAGTTPFEYLLQVWDTNTGSIIYHLQGAQQNLEWFETRLAVTAGNGIQVIEGNTGDYLMGIGLHPLNVLAVSWNSDGSRIASAGMENTVRIWDANTTLPIGDNQPLYILSEHTLPVNEVDWQPNGTMLASASYDGTVNIWETTNGQLLQSIETGGVVLRVQWNPDGTRLAYSGDVAGLGSVVKIITLTTNVP